MRKRTLFSFFAICIAAASSLAQYHTGLVFDDEEYAKTPSRVFNNENQLNLPKIASIKKYCPWPGNQIQLNTSAAWAVSYGAMSILKAKKNNWINAEIISKNSLSPSFLYQKTRSENDDDCLNGTRLTDVLYLAKNQQVASYDNYLEFCPNNSLSGNTPTSNDPGGEIIFSKLFDINEQAEKKIFTIKSAISELQPVVIGLDCPPSLSKAKGLWEPSPSERSAGLGHAMVVVGYNDVLYGGAFEIMNSWGREWGNQGFIWVRYEDLARLTRYAFELFAAPTEKKEITAFEGSLYLLKESKEKIPMKKINNSMYRVETTLDHKTRFQLKINSESFAYAYVIGSDETNAIYPIYPNNNQFTPLLSSTTKYLDVPEKDLFLQLDGQTETNYLSIILSSAEVDYQKICEKLKSQDQALPKALDAVFPKQVRNVHGYIENDAIVFSSFGLGVQKTIIHIIISGKQKISY